MEVEESTTSSVDEQMPRYQFILAIFFGVFSFCDHQIFAQVGSEAAVVERLLGQLEDDNYQSRQNAFEKLSQMGSSPIREVVSRLYNGMPETRARCGRLLSRIALNSDEQDMTRIARVMLLLSENGFQRFRQESKALNSKWKQAQLTRTVDKIREAGIGIETFNMGVPFTTSIETLHLEGSTANNDGVRKNVDVSDPKNVNRILEEVDEILLSSDDENHRRLAEELARPTAPTNLVDHSNAGAGGLIIHRGEVVFLGEASTGQNSFIVTIDESFKGDADNLKLLRMLPSVSQLHFRDREITPEFLRELETINVTQGVSFERCEYDLTATFELLQKRPDLSITASGHETFLGVQLQTESSSEGESRCLIMEVVENSAAKDAGLLANDIVRKVDNVKVSTYGQLILAIGSFKPDEEITLDVLRNQEEELEFKIKLRKRQDDQ